MNKSSGDCGAAPGDFSRCTLSLHKRSCANSFTMFAPASERELRPKLNRVVNEQWLEFIVSGASRPDLNLLGDRVEDRLIYIVRSVGQTVKGNIQGNYILGCIEIGIYVVGLNPLRGSVERQ